MIIKSGKIGSLPKSGHLGRLLSAVTTKSKLARRFVMGKRLDLTRQRFGRLTVVKYTGRSKNSHVMWFCKCDCGNETVVRDDSLKSGNTKSCGCLRLDRTREANTTHGKNKTPIYRTWVNIKSRCQNPKDKKYNIYGGRGIKVCEQWQKFENFYKDMQPHPGSKYSIDRIDNNGDYEPSNCRWATAKQQANNRRSNHLITFKGKTQNMKQWAKEIGLNYSTLLLRINQLGWPLEKALCPRSK